MMYQPFTNDVSMTHSWEHDRLSRELERNTGRTTGEWFRVLERHGARRRGLVRTIDWLGDAQRLPHALATVLSWNYFHPSTLPEEIRKRVEQGQKRRATSPARTRPASSTRPRRAQPRSKASARRRK